MQQLFSNIACYCELAVQQSFFEKHQSCVCTTVTLSHRFKAFLPAFCRQNQFRQEPPEIFANSLPAELWIVPGVQRFANLWCTFGSFRTSEKHEKRSLCRELRGFPNLGSARRSRSFAPQQLKPFYGSSEVLQTLNQSKKLQLRTNQIKSFAAPRQLPTFWQRKK